MKIVKQCIKFEKLCQLCCECFENGDMVKLAQLFQNYDYVDNKTGPGTSVYRALTDGKTKSITEWRKKNKKRQKANEKKITDTRPDKFKPNKK